MHVSKETSIQEHLLIVLITRLVFSCAGDKDRVLQFALLLCLEVIDTVWEIDNWTSIVSG